ncbi:hypothetical protein HZI73_05820 [Vallitalea pronyensis]|uniref:Uncharacterized protein n=1 Tax=Vallitalea pronyensis TaxID=1348613 RepID=A0A8J8MHS3_9FIRM|nr:hypothetical protein [Vallitalea pronyensis]QUI21844.1 hypothetical protein HZI73_05820 [Vallitalea pronyensis]
MMIISCLKHAVSTPNLNDNNQEFSMGVIKPYKEMEVLLDNLDRNNNRHAQDKAIKALKLLQRIMDTKKITVDEKTLRFYEIIDAIKNNEVYKYMKNAVEEILQLRTVR